MNARQTPMYSRVFNTLQKNVRLKQPYNSMLFNFDSNFIIYNINRIKQQNSLNKIYYQN